MPSLATRTLASRRALRADARFVPAVAGPAPPPAAQPGVLRARPVKWLRKPRPDVTRLLVILGKEPVERTAWLTRKAFVRKGWRVRRALPSLPKYPAAATPPDIDSIALAGVPFVTSQLKSRRHLRARTLPAAYEPLPPIVVPITSVVRPKTLHWKNARKHQSARELPAYPGYSTPPYQHFIAGFPQLSETGDQFISRTRRDLNALRDALALGFMPLWEYAQTIGTGTEEQPQYVFYALNTEVVRGALTWGTSGGGEGCVTAATFAYSSNGGSTYDTIGSVTISYTADGIPTSFTWS